MQAALNNYSYNFKSKTLENNKKSNGSQNRPASVKGAYKTQSIYNSNAVSSAHIVANYGNVISFRGKLSGQDFLKWAEQEKITATRLPEIVIKASKYIGEGSSNTAYEIPNCAKYVMRFPKDGFNPGPIKVLTDEFPDLNLGQTVALIGNAKVSKKQTGIPAGIPFKERMGGGLNNVLTYRKHIFRTADMPQEAYDELALTFKKLNDNDLTFDLANPNNILVDTQNKRFNLVDDLTETLNDEDKNTFASIALPLFDTFFAPNLSFHEDLMPSWHTIIDKSLKAARKAGLPEPQKNFHSINYIFNLAGLGNYKR